MSLPSAPWPAVDNALSSAFHLVAAPVAWADTQGRLLGANRAFEAALGKTAQPALGQALADWLGWAEAALALAGNQGWPEGPVRWATASGGTVAGRAVVRGDGHCQVLTLTPQPADAGPASDLSAELGRVRDRLNMAQRLGRLGVWERDLRTGVGHWDPTIWRVFGAEPQGQSPSLDVALQALHPDDRATLREVFARSAARPGHYSCRYRVGPAQGPVRHVRSSWEVLVDAQGQPQRMLGIAVDESEAFELARSADEMHAQLQLAVEVANIAVWQYDARRRCVRFNDQGWALLGLPPVADGLPTQALEALVHPDDLAPLRSQLALASQAGSAGAAGSADLMLRYRRHGESGRRWRHALTRSVARSDAQGPGAGHLGMALDLSARFEQHQHALELARRLEMATSAAGVGVWSVALEEPVTVHWDRQMRALHQLGDGPPPRLNQYLGSLVHPEDRAAVSESMQTLLHRRNGLLDMDLRILLPDGQVRRLATRTSLETDGAGRHLYGVMFDVTERHATETRLRQADERAALAARGAGIGTWESNPDGDFGHWDEQMFRLRGLPPRDTPVLRHEMLAWLHPDDRENNRRTLDSAMAQGTTSNTEFRVVLPDGSLRWLASRSTPVLDELGRTVRRIGINWDVTEVRNATAARQEKLMAQRESLAKSRFLARMSHELRTPLNAVLGFTQLLQADGLGPDEATWRRRVAQMQASGEHLLALIDDVLELSSVESGELPLRLQPVALAPLADTTLPLLELSARAQQVRLTVLGMDGLWVQADPVRLRQVLLNLLSNGIKYNRPGGQVTLSATAAGEQLRLRVEDSGQGMSPAQVAHLFEPFNRLGREREGIAGTGIGLAIVRAAVQQMGGQVHVHSVPGQGSCFELTLQRAEAPQTEAGAGFAMGEPLPLASQPGGGTLLYIEDNEVNLLIVSELVQRRSDLRFLSAPDGHSGLAAARAELPALILLDMQLPDIDGHEVLRRLRADPATAGIRVIALSANAMPEDIRSALEAGCADYWTKPLDLKAFMAALDALFGAAPAG